MRRSVKPIAQTVLAILFISTSTCPVKGEQINLNLIGGVNVKHEIRTNREIWPFVPEFRIFGGSTFEVVFMLDSALGELDPARIKIDMISPEKYSGTLRLLNMEYKRVTEETKAVKELMKVYEMGERDQFGKLPTGPIAKPQMMPRIEYTLKYKALETSKNHVTWKIELPDGREIFHSIDIWVLPGGDVTSMLFTAGYLLAVPSIIIGTLLREIDKKWRKESDLEIMLRETSQIGLKMMGASLATFLCYEILFHGLYMNLFVKETN